MKSPTVLRLVAAAMILILVVPLASVQRTAVAQEEERQRAPLTKLDILIVVDQSGSMFLWSDPPGRACVDEDGNAIPGCRYELPMRQMASQFFLDYFAIEPPGDPRIGLAYFGTQAHVEQGLFDIRDEPSRGSMNRFLGDLPEDPKGLPAYWQWTNPNAMFEAIYDEYLANRSLPQSPGAAPARRPVVILITDGHPDQDWDSVNARSYYATLLEWIQTFSTAGIECFPVMIGLDEYVEAQDPNLPSEFETYADIWRLLADKTAGEYYRVAEQLNAEERRNELLDIFQIIADKLKGNTSGPVPKQCLEPGQRITELIPMQAACELLTVTVTRHSPQIQVALRSPSEVPMEPSITRDTYLIFEAPNPEEGNWSVVIEGSAQGKGCYTVRPAFRCEGLRAELLAPVGAQPQCRDMPVVAEVQLSSGEPVENGRVNVTMTAPDMSVDVVPMDYAGSGRYEGIFQETEQLNEYTLEWTAQDREGKYAPISGRASISVIQQIYVDFAQPRPGDLVLADEDGNVRIQAALMLGCEPTNDGVLLAQTRVTASLVDENGNLIGPVDLQSVEADGIFGGDLQVNPDREAGYTLTVMMQNEARDVEETISDIIRIAPAIPVGYCELVTDAADLGTIDALSRPQQTAVTFLLDCTELEQERSLTLSLDGMLGTLVQNQIQAPPGSAEAEFAVPIQIPAEPEVGSYSGTLRLQYSDGESHTLPLSLEVIEPPPGNCSAWLEEEDLGVVRVRGEFRIPLQLDCTNLNLDQTIEIELDGVPCRLDPDEIQVQAGNPEYQPDLTCTVREGASAKEYEGSLTLPFKDDETRTLPFRVKVTKPPISIPIWLIILIAVVLAGLGGGGYALYRWKTGKGQLTGRIVYVQTPQSIGQHPEVELVGERQVIVLDEMLESGGYAAGSPYSYGSETDTLAEPGPWGQAPAGGPTAPSGHHTELTFTARRGKTEAMVQVTQTNATVLLNEVPVLPGEAPQLLRDGYTIAVGSYTLRYESLMAHEEELDAWVEPEEFSWEAETEQGYGAGGPAFGDFSTYHEPPTDGYDPGGYGTSEGWGSSDQDTTR